MGFKRVKIGILQNLPFQIERAASWTTRRTRHFKLSNIYFTKYWGTLLVISTNTNATIFIQMRKIL